MAIYKQHINKVGGGRNRNVKNEYISWLIAKAAGLTDVVNPVIPVRKTAAGFVIDPVRYDGSLEPAVGITLRNIPGALEPYGRLKSLLNGALSMSQPFCFDKDSVLPCCFANDNAFYAPNLVGFSKYFYGDRVFYPPNTSKSTAYANTFAPTPFPSEMKFLSQAPITVAKKFEDLELFRSSISLEHLWHVVAFWYLTEQYDMNPSNILYIPNVKGEIIPTIIDYDVALGEEGGLRYYSVPLVYTLPQARETLPIGFFKTLLEFPNRKLERIITSTAGVSSILSPLIERLGALKQVTNSPRPITLIDVILSLMKNQEIKNKYNIYSRACNIINASVLDPIMFSGSATAEPTGGDEGFMGLVKFNGAYIQGEVCVIKGEERYVHAYKRHWIFEATAESQLEESSSDLLPVMKMSEMTQQLEMANNNSSWLQFLAKSS